MLTCARISTTLSPYRKRPSWLITHTIKPSNYYRDIHRSKPFSLHLRVLEKNGRGFFQLKTKKEKKKKKTRGPRARRVLARWFTCLLTNTRDEGLERVANCTLHEKEQFFPVGRISFFNVFNVRAHGIVPPLMIFSFFISLLQFFEQKLTNVKSFVV